MVGWSVLAAVLVAGAGAPTSIEAVTTGKAGVQAWLRLLGVPDGAGDKYVQERLIVLSPAGRIVYVATGRERTVALTVEVDTLLLTPAAGLTLVHNHPSGSGLSQDDLQQLEKPGVAAMVAVGHDGSVYVARRGPRFPSPGLVGFDGCVYTMTRKAADRVLAQTADARLRARFSEHLQHVVALGLARAGVLEYTARLAGERKWTFDDGRIFLARVRDAVTDAVPR